MQTNVLSLFSNTFIWQGDRRAERQSQDVLPSQFKPLDKVLPGGGWPKGTLTELLHAESGTGELSLLLPMLATLSKKTHVALIAPPHIPYAPALAQAGLQLDRLVVVQPDTDSDAWWCAEQLMRSGQFKAVLFWPDRFDVRGLRRLQAACAKGMSAGFVWHQPHAAQHPSPAPLRLLLNAKRHADQLEVTILKRRGSMMVDPITIDLREPTRSLQEQPQPVAANVNPQQRAQTGYAIRRTEDIAQRTHNATNTKRMSMLRWPQMANSADTLRLSTTPDR
jgi:cell division inhibitor SulA